MPKLINGSTMTSISRILNNLVTRSTTIENAVYNLIPPFNVFATHDAEQRRIIAVVDMIVERCFEQMRSENVLVPRAIIKSSVQHYIKECIEVMSWLENDENKYTLVFSESELISSIVWTAKNSTNIDVRYLPDRTVALDKKSVVTTKGPTLAGEEIEYGVLKRKARSIKVFMPICYEKSPVKYSGDALENLIENNFIRERQIHRRNIYIYLGPIDKKGLSSEQNAEEEKRCLQNWLDDNATYIRENRIKVLIYDIKNVSDAHKPLIYKEWYQSNQYKKAERIFIQMLLNTDIEKTLETRLMNDVVRHLQPKFAAGNNNNVVPEVKENNDANQYRYQYSNHPIIINFKAEFKRIESLALIPGFDKKVLKMNLQAHVLQTLEIIKTSSPNFSEPLSYTMFIPIFNLVWNSTQFRPAPKVFSLLELYQTEEDLIYRNTLSAIRYAAAEVYEENCKVIHEAKGRLSHLWIQKAFDPLFTKFIRPLPRFMQSSLPSTYERLDKKVKELEYSPKTSCSQVSDKLPSYADHSWFRMQAGRA